MSHPITGQKRALIIYSLLWLVALVLNIILFNSRQEFDTGIATVDAIISTVLYAFLGLLIYYPTRYIPFQRHNPVYSTLAHVIAGLLVLLTWLLVTIGLLSFIFSNQTAYRDFLLSSIYWRAFVGLMIYLVIVLVYYLIMYNRSMREQAKAEERLKTLVKESELNMLKSQINPHFLFNSLNSIASLTLSNPEEAKEMIVRLSDFLRYSLKNRENEFVTLKEELGRMMDYLAIEKIRFGEKLNYTFKVDEYCEQIGVPTMILQPLIENAIKHGVYESLDPVKIDFQCHQDREMLFIELSNDFDPDQPQRKGTGVGLQNVAQRMKLAYDDKGRLNWKMSDRRFIVELVVPKEK